MKEIIQSIQQAFEDENIQIDPMKTAARGQPFGYVIRATNERKNPMDIISWMIDTDGCFLLKTSVVVNGDFKKSLDPELEQTVLDISGQILTMQQLESKLDND